MESKKIRKLKILRNGIKHIARAIRGEYTFAPRKEIKAEELEEICEMMCPSSSRFEKHLHEQGIEIDSKDRKPLYDVFDAAFDFLFPGKVKNEDLDNLIEKTRGILVKSNPYAKVLEIDFSFVYSMVPNAEAILARIKDKGLEKHIIFCEYRESFEFMETFWGAVKQFLTEKLFGFPGISYSDDVYIREYKNKWSLIFNRKVVWASSNIEIKNLKIIDRRIGRSCRIKFDCFNCIVFSNNIFCKDVHIGATRRKEVSNAADRKNGFIFYKNFFSYCHIYCKDIHYLIFDRNNFTKWAGLHYFPRHPNDTVREQHGRGSPIIRLIKNKVKGALSIKNTATTVSGSIPIKIEFLRKNRLTGLRIDMGNNKLGWEMTKSDEMVKSDIENILFEEHEEIKPRHNDPYILRRYKNFFLKLKNQAIERKDRSAEFNYARKERYFDWQLSSQWEDRLIFWWGEFVSKSGVSWGRSLMILSILQVICIGLPVWWITKDCELGIRLAIETLNPLTTLSANLSEKSYWISFLTVFQKIYLSILLYETIKVLRRFSK